MMQKTGYLLAALFLLAPVAALAEKVQGTLDEVSFIEGMISVDGVMYELDTETTRVMYHGAKLGEEDLRPGDDVVLIIGNQRNRKERRQLEAIILVRGSKTGLDS